METALSLLLEDPDIHEKYIERYRAEYLLEELWRLTQGRVSWRVVSTSPIGSYGEEGIGGDPNDKEPRDVGLDLAPRYLDYPVPAVAILNFKLEIRRIWSASLAAGLGTLTVDERHAWDEHMLRSRYSAVFQVVHRWGMVRQSNSIRSSKEIANAALKLARQSELLKGGQDQ